MKRRSFKKRAAEGGSRLQTRRRSKRLSAQKKRLAREEGRSPSRRPFFRYTHDGKEDLAILCKRYGTAEEFSKELLAEAHAIADDYKKQIEETPQGRQDLRDELIFTIDGADARDHDDAVSLRVEECVGGPVYHLGVHIADVSHFVRNGSLLDDEAFSRGTSVYLPDRVFPMFPPVLSNDICSLREGKTRLTVTGMFALSASGEVRSARFFRSVIKSRYRLTYHRVQEVLDGIVNVDQTLERTLKTMLTLSHALRASRLRRGALELETKETVFGFENDRVASVSLRGRIMSERIIEEFMLVANHEVAKLLHERGTGFYRVHEAPEPSDLEKLMETFKRYQITVKTEGSHDPLREASLTDNVWTQTLRAIEDEGLREQASGWVLQVMKRAEYSTRGIGHYGLALQEYTHFTSPIRRYPDLIVHRLLFPEAGREMTMNLHEIAQSSSSNERKAVDCEREYQRIKTIRYILEQDANRVFSVTIMGVHPRGHVYVRDRFSGIEGMIHRSQLPVSLRAAHEEDLDPVKPKSRTRREQGSVPSRDDKRVSQAMLLGQEVDVRLERADPQRLKIYFRPVLIVAT